VREIATDPVLIIWIVMFVGEFRVEEIRLRFSLPGHGSAPKEPQSPGRNRCSVDHQSKEGDEYSKEQDQS
jgi:hypothetical protein